jgi:hypothetical protein
MLTILCVQLADPHARKFTTMELRKAMTATLADINRITVEVSQETGHRFDPHLMNFVVSDGENVVATRYVIYILGRSALRYERLTGEMRWGSDMYRARRTRARRCSSHPARRLKSTPRVVITG